MLKNYLKIAWRNLIRNKSFSLLNILGLSIGLAVTGIIMIWISFELGVDQFHEKKERIYQVYNKYPVEGEIWTWNSTPKIMAPTIKKDYAEVEHISRFFYDIDFLFSKDDKKLKTKGNIVDSEFLNIFSFPLVEGNIETVLQDVNSVVITESFAKKLFGDKDAVGQLVKIDNADSFMVSGILKDLPENTGFNFDFLIPWTYLDQKGWNDKYWGNNSVATYLTLKEGTDYETFAKKIATLREAYDKDAPEMVTYLYPWSRYWLYAEFENGKEVGGRIKLIRMFGIIALIILIIACINFMNLSTAQSEKRAKEVGIRKVVGAKRTALIGQFYGESILIAFLAGIIGLALILLCLPMFATFIEKPLKLDFYNGQFWLITLMVLLLTGLLSGSYPALFLSKFNPAAVLKGVFKKKNSSINPRKVLVVVQFTISIILITSSIIVGKQLQNVQNRQTGYSKNNLIYTVMEGDIEKNYELIKEELLSSGAVASVTKTGSPITETWSNSMGLEWQGKDEDNKTLVHRLPVDDAVVKTFGLELIEGRDFDLRKYATDSTAIILNESAVELMKFEEPLGQKIKDNGIDWHVIGVVKDFIMNSPFQKIEPMAIEGAKAWFNVIHIKFNSTIKTADGLAEVESIFKKHNPEYIFNYEFVDDAYGEKFKSERQTGTLVSLFTILTIFISCLGLFGLASYMAENRIKEIGVRKVLGASVLSITTLLSKDFLKLVFISFVIAVPVSWYFMASWLEEFAYRITISWWTFALAGILAFVIALITVSYKAIKAAIVNPVKSLRTE